MSILKSKPVQTELALSGIKPLHLLILVSLYNDRYGAPNVIHGLTESIGIQRMVELIHMGYVDAATYTISSKGVKYIEYLLSK